MPRQWIARSKVKIKPPAQTWSYSQALTLIASLLNSERQNKNPREQEDADTSSQCLI